MIDQLFKRLEERKEEMIEIRRYLHQHPEVSFKEEKTAQYIADFYEGKDVEIARNVRKWDMESWSRLLGTSLGKRLPYEKHRL